MASSTSQFVSMTDLAVPFTPCNKRKRFSESPQSTRTVSPVSGDDEEEDDDGCDDSASSSSTITTTSGRIQKTNKASAEADPVRAARLEARAARNRVSAQHSRDRKKNHVQNLEAEVSQLRAEKMEMTERIQALENLVKTLLGAGAANGKGMVEPVTTLKTTTKPTTFPASILPISFPHLSGRIESSLDTTSSFSSSSLSPQALCQEANDSSLAAPTSIPLSAISASLFSCMPTPSTFTNDLTVNDARLPAVEAIERTSCAAQTQQRASATSSRKVEERSMQMEKLMSNLSTWPSQSMAAAVRQQVNCPAKSNRVERRKDQAVVSRHDRSDWERKTAGWYSTLKESSKATPSKQRQIIRIRVRIRKVKSKRDKIKSLKKAIPW